MERVASCVFGQFRVRVAGDAFRVNICNCADCQRRSGSAFQIGTWFRDTQALAIESERRG